VRPGERGIRSSAYRESLVFLDARQRRAAHKRTAFGKEMIEHAWALREFATLRRLWDAGASVPYPVAEVEHGFLMQFIGTSDRSAPRLADLRPGPDEARRLLDRVVDEVRILAREGIVHGDLSAYNVLVQHGRPWIIDLPQALDLYTNPRGMELFERDVSNICAYFVRLGIRCASRGLIKELLEYDAGVVS
jgi:RIO kinase 1